VFREDSGWQTALMPILTAVVTAVFASSLTTMPATKRSDTAGETVTGEATPSAWETYTTAWEDPLHSVCDVAGPEHGPGSENTNQLPTLDGVRVSAESYQQLSTSVARVVSNSGVPSTTGIRVSVVLRPVDGSPGLIASEYRRADRLAIRTAMEADGFDFSASNNLIGALSVSRESGSGDDSSEILAPMLGTRLAYEIGRRVTETDNQSSIHIAVVVYVPKQLLDRENGLGFAEEVGEEAIAAARSAIVKPSNPASAGTCDAAMLILRGDSDDLNRDVKCLHTFQSVSTGQDDEIARYLVYTSSTADVQGVPDALLRKPMEKNAAPKLHGEELIPVIPVIPSEFSDTPRHAPLYWRHGESRYVGRILGSDVEVIYPKIERELRLRNVYFHDRADASVALICDTGNQYGSLFKQAATEAAKEAQDSFEIIQYHGPIGVPPRRPLNRAAFDDYRAHREEKSRAGTQFGSATPSGPQSLDFIERGLMRYESSLRATNKTATAFIVCVYDAKDRRPIIQLIRERFPTSVIVVTDMNAVLTDPLDAAFMRNVIVVSHLGLSAGDAQEKHPPFRDHYDTSTYLAVRHFFVKSSGYEHWPHERSACTACGESEPAWARELTLAPPPGRVWEITTQGAAALGTAAVEKHTLYDDERAPLPGRWLMHTALQDSMVVVLIWFLVIGSIGLLWLIPRPGTATAQSQADEKLTSEKTDRSTNRSIALKPILRRARRFVEFSLPHALPALLMAFALTAAYLFRGNAFGASCLFIMPALSAILLARPTALTALTVHPWVSSALVGGVLGISTLLMWPSPEMQILAKSAAVIACITGGALVVAVPFFERSEARGA
jgi:hypothetical protein